MQPVSFACIVRRKHFTNNPVKVPCQSVPNTFVICLYCRRMQLLLKRKHLERMCLYSVPVFAIKAPIYKW